MAILLEITDKKINTELTNELNNSLTESMHIDSDTLPQPILIEPAELNGNSMQFDFTEVANYLATAFSDALKSAQKIDDLNLFSDDSLPDANPVKDDLLNTDAKNIERNIWTALQVKSVKDALISKDIQQLIQKSLMELRPNTQGILNSEGDVVNTEATVNLTMPDESDRSRSFFGKTETISGDKKTNGAIHDSPTPIIKQNVGVLSSKDYALNTKAQIDLAEKEAVTIVPSKTSFDYTKEHSDQKEPNYFGQSNKAVINDNTSASAGQAFSSFIREAISEGTSTVANKPIRVDSSEIVMTQTPDTKALKLTIDPDGIGMLDIELTLEKGLVNAQISASESAGKHFLENNLSGLLNSLLREGLNIGKFSISLGYKRDDTSDEGFESTQKTSKAVDELMISESTTKNHLISIFV